jgi:hypothetical protein
MEKQFLGVQHELSRRIQCQDVAVTTVDFIRKLRILWEYNVVEYEVSSFASIVLLLVKSSSYDALGSRLISYLENR